MSGSHNQNPGSRTKDKVGERRSPNNPALKENRIHDMVENVVEKTRFPTFIVLVYRAEKNRVYNIAPNVG